MLVARHPPYRPVLALLTHTVLTSDSGVEAYIWVGLQDFDFRQQSPEVFIEAFPCPFAPLAPPP
jgi:hypothetical protein